MATETGTGTTKSSRKEKKKEAAASVAEAAAPVAEGTEASAVIEEVTTAVPVANAAEAAPVEGAAEGEGKTKKKAPAKPAVPDDLKKGNRICASCKTPESEFLAKNSRYSLCQGVDVYCYRKGDRVFYDRDMASIETEFADKVGQFTTDTPPRPLIEQVSGTGIKPGILVRGANKVTRKKADKPADTTAAVEATKTAAANTEAAAANLATETAVVETAGTTTPVAETATVTEQ